MREQKCERKERKKEKKRAAYAKEFTVLQVLEKVREESERVKGEKEIGEMSEV